MLILFIYSFANKSQSYSFLFLDFMLFYLSFSYNLQSSFRLFIYYPLPLTAVYYTPTPAPLYIIPRPPSVLIACILRKICLLALLEGIFVILRPALIQTICARRLFTIRCTRGYNQNTVRTNFRCIFDSHWVKQLRVKCHRVKRHRVK